VPFRLTFHTKDIVAFPLLHWFRYRSAVLRYTYVISLVCYCQE